MINNNGIHNLRPYPMPSGLTTGEGGLTKVIYGRTVLRQGEIIAQTLDGSDLVLAVGWGLGCNRQIEAIFLDGVEPSVNVLVAHYQGQPHQKVDGILSAAIASYTDDLVYSAPSTVENESVDVAGCYSVLVIPTTELNNIPTISCIMQGRLCPLPDSQDYPANGLGGSAYDVPANENFFGNTVLAVHGGTDDESYYQNAKTLYGGIGYSGGAINFDGAGDTIQFVERNTGSNEVLGRNFLDNPNIWQLKDKNFCIECKFETDTIAAGTADLAMQHHYTTGVDRQWVLYRTGASLLFGYSTNGTSWYTLTIHNALIVNTEYDVKVERMGGQLYCYIDNVLFAQHNIGIGVALHESTADIWLGSYNNASYWSGKIISFRITALTYRYGHPVAAYNTTNANYYSDYGEHLDCREYLEFPSAFQLDLALDKAIGLGGEVWINGMDDAFENNYRKYAGAFGDYPRMQASVIIDNSRTIPEWMDMLSEYAETHWFFNDGRISIEPHRNFDQHPKEEHEGQQRVASWEAADWSLEGNWVAAGSPNTTKVFSNVGTTIDRLSYTIPNCVIGQEYVIHLEMEFGTWSPAAYEYILDIVGGEPDGHFGSASTGGTSRDIYYRFTADEETVTIQIDNGEIVNGASVVDSLIMHVYSMFHVIEQWERDSLNVVPAPKRSLPTALSLTWLKEVADTSVWGEREQQHMIAGAENGDIPVVQSSITMPGFVDDLSGESPTEGREAYQRQRLGRGYHKTQISLVVRGSGACFRKGRILYISRNDLNISLVMVVERVEMTSRGNWRVSGHRYHGAHYHDKI